MILRLIAIALFDLPQPIILPGLDVGGIGFQRALVPELRDLVVAELAIGIADQVGDGRHLVMTERLQLLDGGSIIVALIDRRIRRAVAGGESVLLKAGLLVFLVLLGAGRRRSGIVVAGRIDRGEQGRRNQRHAKCRESEPPDRKACHPSLHFQNVLDPTPALSVLNTSSISTFPPVQHYSPLAFSRARRMAMKRDAHVTKMNERHRGASGWVQAGTPKVAP